MQKISFQLGLILGGIFLFSLPCLGQVTPDADTSKLLRIELLNENAYTGKIISRDSETIVFESRELGVINIKVTNIKSIEEISMSRIIEGEYWPENPQSTRYLWGPTGYGLRKGDGYYQNIWIFFNQFSFGITDQTSVGFGLVPLFLVSGAPTPVWITPKVSIPIHEKLNIGVGALIGSILGADTGGPFGIAYGTMTFGDRDKNFNMGIGYGLVDGQWANIPTVTISGMIRTGRKGYILTENYLFDAGNETVGILSLGGRTVGRRLSIDYGGVIPLGPDAGFAIIPWLGMAVAFGKRRNF